MIHTKKLVGDEELLGISSANPELRFELVNSEVIAMPPTGGRSGNLCAQYATEITLWCRRNRGKSFNSSCGFKLPNGNVRSPDAAVVLPSHPSYDEADKTNTFISGAPDFLIEIRSYTDSMTLLRTKMLEWIENGARLAFLIDPFEQKAHVYRRDRSITEYPYTAKLSGEDVLTGFEVCPAEMDPQT